MFREGREYNGEWEREKQRVKDDRGKGVRECKEKERVGREREKDDREGGRKLEEEG